jgi:OmpA-OmpF porin, OOP family
MKKIVLTLFMSTVFLSAINAQTSDRPLNIGLHGGIAQYAGSLGNGFLKFDQAAYGFGGLSLSNYLNSILDVTMTFNMGEVGFHKNPTSFFRTRFFAYDVGARIKFLGEKEKFTPYVLLGAGFTHFQEKFTVKSAGKELSMPVLGLGFNFKLSDALTLMVQEKAVYSIDGVYDGEKTKNGDFYFFHTLGLSLNLGKVKDTDGDGVPDKKDKCPGTEAGVKVDLFGCPIDTDKDGIPDYQDECPDKAGTALTKGCPDKDGDGIPDHKDECPDVAGLSAFNGCADSDGDGIPDKDDRCPNEKGSKALKGCPDSDGDGIADIDDKCTNTPSGVKVDAKGCPIDTDGDGIPDYLDKCPEVKGVVANKGCPEVKEEVKKVFNQALKGVQFASGKNTILPKSFPILNSVAEILKQNPEYKLEINGHTDNLGNPVKNKTLSQGRADAVKEYLVKKGIEGYRMKATGYGDEKPIADNKTPAGRTENRRVEFVVEF